MYAAQRHQCATLGKNNEDIKYSFNKNSFDYNLKIKPLLLKAKDWSYEEEWRIIFDDSIISEYKENFYPYEPYIKFLKPQKVYMGMDISEKDEKLIKNICKKNKIPFLDFSNNPKYVHNDSLFKDGSHLNEKGADEFTKDFIRKLRPLLK